MGLDHTRYIVFLKSAIFYQNANPGQRIGQAYYNCFRIMWPGFEREVVNTEFDCFNDDNKLPGFLTWVQAKLDILDAGL